MSSFKAIFMVLFFTLSGAPSFAQGGNTGNGGESIELQVKNLIQKLPYFIDQPAYRGRFRDIEISRLYRIAPLVQVNIVDQQPRDRRGRIRTAVNIQNQDHFELRLHRASIISCLSKAELKKICPVLLFHELLNFAGYEILDESAEGEVATATGLDRQDWTPESLTSVYPISSRILLLADELEDYEPLKLDFKTFVFSCRDQSTFWSMEHFGLNLRANGELEFRTYVHQMFKMEDRFPKTHKKYNDRVHFSLKDPKRVIAAGGSGSFQVGAVTEIDLKLPRMNKHKHFKESWVRVRGQLYLQDRFSRRLVGTVVVSSVDRHGLSNSISNVVFECRGVPQENTREQYDEL